MTHLIRFKKIVSNILEKKNNDLQLAWQPNPNVSESQEATAA